MNAIELIILNLEEVRRRSIKVWRGIPEEMLDWKPADGAMSCKEMIRHVLDSDHFYHLAIKNRGSIDSYVSPFEERPFTSIEDELKFAEAFRAEFIRTVRNYTPSELDDIRIDRSDVGYIRSLGDMLLRIAYHESVHTGQLLDYLRTANIERPDIWD